MKGSISISRPSYGDERKKILIQIKDKASKVGFVCVEVDLDVFSSVLTGLSEQDCEFNVKSLEFIGKEKETKPISFKMPTHNYENRKDIAIGCANKILSDGWMFNKYLGSKDSFTGHGDDVYCNSTAYRYV